VNDREQQSIQKTALAKTEPIESWPFWPLRAKQSDAVNSGVRPSIFNVVGKPPSSWAKKSSPMFIIMSARRTRRGYLQKLSVSFAGRCSKLAAIVARLR
jgi:hypothetical protein